ncbi:MULTISPECIES: tRNA lysidine(34) synthetase TilS [Cryobacterium]|uniref:tRNA lysidine(34) synthetase TilS n=1 Tax=Cryobacterium TaxID=69578 RepID=UPI000B883D00|nr:MULTISPECIES: tRNA lysidine(34) synthetase TilS [Cryobacterium]TFD44338.1 tRNA lysidine(34) synthetase TilS [Cryobacterium sp. TMT1-2-1]TFD89518.1 tRNA lysidine(34) synthetase TilS [Cryobacterium psychrotolerans]
MESAQRPRLSPAIADVRRAVRGLLPADGLVLVGLSGGADSLALAAATAFEAPRAGPGAGAVIVDHGLQHGSAEVAEAAARQARELGLGPVLVLPVTVQAEGAGEGPEAAARSARYAAFDRALAETGARHILLGHTLDDQAETVLLGLARGSGPTSLSGMAAQNGPYLRPLLGIRRRQTRQACLDAGLVPWEDPHNSDPRYGRVRVRDTVLPILERELGPGVAGALARTADQLREDAEALDALVRELAPEICEPAEAGIAISVAALAANPPALRQRIIRFVAESEFGVSLERVHTLAVARLVTDWHGQGALDLPGVRVVRQHGWLILSRPGHAHSKGPSRSHGTSRH